MSRKLTSSGHWSITLYESKKKKNPYATENESVQDKLNNQKVENADFILFPFHLAVIVIRNTNTKLNNKLALVMRFNGIFSPPLSSSCWSDNLLGSQVSAV